MAGTPQQHGKLWRVRWRHPDDNGREQATATTADDALALKAYVEDRGHRLRTGDPVLTEGRWRHSAVAANVSTGLAARRRSKLTFHGFAEEEIADRLKREVISVSTENLYRRYLRNCFVDWHNIELAAFTKETVAEKQRELKVMVNEKGGRYSAHVRANMISFALTILNAAFHAGHISTNPCRGVEHRRQARSQRGVDRALEMTEYIALRACAPDEQTAVLLDFLAGTGARINEAFAAKKSWLSLTDAPEVIFHEKWTVEPNGARYLAPCKARDLDEEPDRVPIDDGLASVLGTWASTRYPDDFLFQSHYGLPLTYQNWHKGVWSPMVKAAALGRITPHDLRHSYGAWLLERNLDIYLVSQRLRHRSVTVTEQVYAHITRRHNESHRNALNGLFHRAA